jgi:hypothetical protein
MPPDAPASRLPPPLIALAGWIVPGAGYFLIGERRRAVVVAVTIVLLFLGGLLIGGIRVIDVPGFDDTGLARMRDDRWTLTTAPVAEIANKPWYVPQIFAGPLTLGASRVSLSAARRGVDPSHARLRDIGTLYTAVAGMLNLMVLIDAAHRAAREN